MIDNYELFLFYLNKKLDYYFEDQKPYIACKKGCAKCCVNAEFPYSELEACYLKLGYLKLDNEVRNIVTENISKVKKEKTEFRGNKFLYTCPFLINNECCVYNFRGIVCRTFGLITVCDADNVNVPFCHMYGLNYANVVDSHNNKISNKMWLSTGISIEPHAFNDISYDFLTGNSIEKKFNITFGEKRPLIDWL